MDKIQEKVNSAFNAAGGLGLFFSFTEVGSLTHYLNGLIKQLQAMLC